MAFREDFIYILKRYGRLPFEVPLLKLEKVKRLEEQVSEQKKTIDEITKELEVLKRRETRVACCNI